jgi:hypothetical protein
MSPIIAAAFIGVGGSVLVAITSFLTTRAITARQLADAHRSRVWDKQAAAYTDAIVGVQWRQGQRNRQLAVIKMLGREPPGSTQPASPVDWTELQGRLFAFASPQVLSALQAASEAGREAESRTTHLFGLITFAVEPGEQWNRETDSTDEIERAVEAADQAAQAANDKEDALIDAIRADLHGERGRALSVLSSRTGSGEKV